MAFEQFEHFEHAQRAQERRPVARPSAHATGSSVMLPQTGRYLPVAARAAVSCVRRATYPSRALKNAESRGSPLRIAHPSVARRLIELALIERFSPHRRFPRMDMAGDRGGVGLGTADREPAGYTIEHRTRMIDVGASAGHRIGRHALGLGRTIVTRRPSKQFEDRGVVMTARDRLSAWLPQL